MRGFEVLHQTVEQALGTGRLGEPAAARLVLHGAADHGLLERLAGRCLEAVSSWLKSRPHRINALGDARRGQISILAWFEGGQSALVSVGCGGAERPLWEAVAWGSRGTVSWEGDGGLEVEANAAEPPLSDEARRLMRLIREALLEAEASAPAAREPSASKPAPDRSPSLAPQRPPYGVLLVSGDHTHQANYALALAADPRCKLIGLTDEADVPPRRRQLNERLAARLGVPILSDLKEALQRSDVHVVSICAEPERRARIILQAAQAGKHLYLDKPLAASLGEARAIAAAVGQASVVHHMFSLVHIEPAQRMRQVVQSGTLGELTALHFDLCFAKGPAGTARLGQRRRESPRPDRYELPDAKRELTNVGVYPVTALLWLLGRKVRRVCATTGNYFFQEHQTRDLEDFGQMLLELDNGAVATISAGRTGWRSHPAAGLNRAYLIGDRRAAAFDASRPRAELWADADAWTPPARDPEDPMGMWAGPKAPEHTARPKQAWLTPSAGDPALADAGHFLNALEAGRPSEVPVELAAAATEILLAAYRSAARGGEFVPLPLEE